MKLELNLTTSLQLTPQLVQSLKILQMDSQELLEHINEMVQENPVLEVEAPAGVDKLDELRRKLDWLDSRDVSHSSEPVRDDDDYIDPFTFIAAKDVGAESLFSHLTAQLDVMELDPDVRSAARFIAHDLSDSGYFEEDMRSVAMLVGVSEEAVEKALDAVRSLDPAGVGARDLSDCLCLQLERRGETGIPLAVAREHLEELGRSRYNSIAKKLGCGVSEIYAAKAVIQGLDPRPGSAFPSAPDTVYVVPDVLVAEEDGKLEVTLNSEFAPTVYISEHYRKMLAESTDKEVCEYLTEKLSRASNLIKSIDQRKITLLACAKFIVSSQEEFVRSGQGHLRPMTLYDVAQAVGIHESTVSRAVSGKYVRCPRGTMPLSAFFSRAVESDGGDVSVDTVKRMIKEAVDGEDKASPLSDQKIHDLLLEKGHDVPRRTVAKYRGELGIPSTTSRREREK